MSVEIIIGDALTELRKLPADSVDCCVTSPPYWGLRDYGVAGQLGMEPTYQEHVAAIADVFDEIRRVLKPSGTCWMNYGDSYATSPNGRSAADVKELTDDDRTFRDKPFSTIQGVLKPKDLCGIPWRVAFALQERGWWLRQDIIWSKPNPMPESIKDRCTKAHEYLFLLSKRPRYYFDAEAIAEGLAPASVIRLTQDVENQAGSLRVPGKTNGPMKAVKRTRGVPPRHAQYGEMGDHQQLDSVGLGGLRNRRSVWTVATQPFSEAHFATFPPDLVGPCILAGCPVGGIVLDPFGGAGTTGLVADRLQRNAILIEINPEYAEMARGRIDTDRGALLDAMEAA